MAHWQLLGMLVLWNFVSSSPVGAQCDFIHDITGIVQGAMPTGDAANPNLHTHVYVLVDNQGLIFRVGATPDFLAVPAGFYNLYAVNYANSEASIVQPLLAVGSPWFNVKICGNDDVNFCVDYTLPYGSGCPIVVCDEMIIGETDTLDRRSFQYNTNQHSQNYCLICNDRVVDMDVMGKFPLSNYSVAHAGANCQLFGVNFNTTAGNPLQIGDVWTTTMDAECANTCIDIIGMNLNIMPILLNQQLLAFDGQKEEADNVLSWEIEGDQNIDYYLLEHAADGLHFKELSWVPAKGTSEKSVLYKYRHILPELGTQYYRLKLIAIDGSVEYSRVVALSRKKEQETNITIYPNPTKDAFWVEFYWTTTGKMTYEIQNVLGQQLKKGSQKIEKGWNKIAMDLQDFPSATYWIALDLNDKRIQKRLIKY